MGDESGTSPITAVFGVGIFLGFLLLAVQVLLHLYATSTVSAAAFDAARLVAGEDAAGCGAAEQHALGLLGGYGQDVAITCTRGADTVTLTIAGPSPAPMVAGFTTWTGLGDIEREARVRVEDFRAPGGTP